MTQTVDDFLMAKWRKYFPSKPPPSSPRALRPPPLTPRAPLRRLWPGYSAAEGPVGHDGPPRAFTASELSRTQKVLSVTIVIAVLVKTHFAEGHGGSGRSRNVRLVPVQQTCWTPATPRTSPPGPVPGLGKADDVLEINLSLLPPDTCRLCSEGTASSVLGRRRPGPFLNDVLLPSSRGPQPQQQPHAHGEQAGLRVCRVSPLEVRAGGASERGGGRLPGPALRKPPRGQTLHAGWGLVSEPSSC